jgi:prepilin-type N-terminal cleavage/methylation domain-containing protein
MTPHRSPQHGYTLVELLMAIALVGILAAAAIPTGLSQIEEQRLDGAARYLSTWCVAARSEAVRRGAFVAIRFEADAPEGSWAFRIYLDGNRNGVRTGDIHDGTDAPLRGRDRLADHFAGIRFGIAAGVTGIDPAKRWRRRRSDPRRHREPPELQPNWIGHGRHDLHPFESRSAGDPPAWRNGPRGCSRSSFRNADGSNSERCADRRAHPAPRAASTSWISTVLVRPGRVACLLDISDGGALIEIDTPLRPGSRITSSSPRRRRALRCAVTSRAVMWRR